MQFICHLRIKIYKMQIEDKTVMDSCLTVYSVLTIHKQMDGEYDCEILLSKNIYYVIIVLANVF